MLAAAPWDNGGSTAYAFVPRNGRLKSAMVGGEVYDEDGPTLSKAELTRALADSIAPPPEPAPVSTQRPTAPPARAQVEAQADWRLIAMGAALAIMTGISAGLAAFVLEGFPSCPLLRDTRAAEILEGRSFSRVGAAHVAPQPPPPRPAIAKPRMVAPRDSGIIREVPF